MTGHAWLDVIIAVVAALLLTWVVIGVALLLFV